MEGRKELLHQKEIMDCPFPPVEENRSHEAAAFLALWNRRLLDKGKC